jgi:hypothetical protein
MELQKPGPGTKRSIFDEVDSRSAGIRPTTLCFVGGAVLTHPRAHQCRGMDDDLRRDSFEIERKRPFCSKRRRNSTPSRSDIPADLSVEEISTDRQHRIGHNPKEPSTELLVAGRLRSAIGRALKQGVRLFTSLAGSRDD